MEITTDVESTIRRALESAEEAVYELRKVLDSIHAQGACQMTSHDDMKIVEHLKDIVQGSKRP